MEPRFDLPVALILCFVLSASFHGQLARAQDFNFPTGKLTSASFTALKDASVDSSGNLILNATTEEAQALYASPFTLSGTASSSMHSFSTFFTFSANATNGNGTVAFVMVPAADQSGGLAEARNTLTVEFDTTCSTGMFNGSNGGWFNGGRGGPGGWGGGGWGGGGPFGGFGGFQVQEYANDTLVAINAVGGYGPNWDGDVADPPYFCSQQPPADVNNPSFEYQVVVEYNASTETVWVGSPSCGPALARTTQFDAKDLSALLRSPVYVGFIVTGGGVFELSQWNFTSNATTSTVTSLALSSVVGTTTPAGVSDGGVDGHSGSRLATKYVVAFSVLGAVIGMAAVAALCCLCGRRRRMRRAGSPMFVAEGVGTIPESKVVFDAAKPPMAAPRRTPNDRDTAPLNTDPSSTLHAPSTGAASWLQPVAPR